MKVAIVVHYFLPNYVGGTEIATLNIAKNLTKKGHEVHIITWLDKGFPKNSMQEGFYIHRVFGKNIRLLSPLLYWINIFICLKKIQPDIIHVQNFGLELPAFFSKKLLKTPFIINARGSENIYHRSFIKKYLQKLALKGLDKLLVQTDYKKKELKKIFKGEILVVPNGINLSIYRNILKSDVKENNKKNIIFVGRLLPIKGLDYLMNAMKIIQNKNKNVFLTLVGDGYYRKSLEKMIKKLEIEKAVTFTGKIPNTEIPKYLSNSDVFVLPSLSEGFPNVVLEAMAAGLPIVASNIGGLSELIKNNENGYLVETKNPEQLADGLLKILQNPEIKTKMSQNNLKKAKNYSWESVVFDLEKIYLDTIKSSKV